MMTAVQNLCSNGNLAKVLIPLNCVQYNLTGNDCANYINIYLYNYAGLAQTQSLIWNIPTQGYSSCKFT